MSASEPSANFAAVAFGRGFLGWGTLALAVGAISALACSDSKPKLAGDAGPIAAGEAGAGGAAGATASENAGSNDSGLPVDPLGAGKPCNGTPKLCDKPFSAVTFLGTHLSFASDGTWPTQTQGRTLSDQLHIGGVRALELEIHDDAGALAVCQENCTQVSNSLASVLRDVSAFVTANQTDVLTLVVRTAVPVDALSHAFEAQGLDTFAYPAIAGKPWPTLQHMIDAKQRLVVFVVPTTSTPGAAGASGDEDTPDASTDLGALPSWMLSLSDFAWQAGPSEGTDCAITSGNPSSPLALLDQYVAGETASDAVLAAAHVPEVIAARLTRCNDDRGHTPNFVFVNFAEVGDPGGGAQIANGLR